MEFGDSEVGNVNIRRKAFIIMSSWFKKPDAKAQMRENNRNLRRANRDLGSDRRELERKERGLENEIKKAAKLGQKETCTVLAKQLVRLRKQKTANFSGVQTLGGLTKKICSHIHSMGTMSQVMGQTVSTMKTMEKQMPVEHLSKNMKEFQIAQEKLGISEEIMNNTLDDILDEYGDEEEQNAIVNQVLDEIGIECQSQVWYSICLGSFAIPWLILKNYISILVPPDRIIQS
uniref:Charged multivesicular body protein 2b n=1 Tax=Angiostrongylus cantonensis TaxID=6313 RepID=A0A0K0DME4_ANGCA